MNRIQRRIVAGALRRCSDRGFSLIELVVVVAVLGVLAAIAVPSHLEAQNGSKDASMQVDLANAKNALVAFGTDHDGDLPSSVSRSGAGLYEGAEVDLTAYGWTAGASTADLAFERRAESTWCVLGTSSTGAVYAVTTRSAVVRTASCPS